MKNLSILFLFLVSYQSVFSQVNTLQEFNEKLNIVLKLYISEGLVDYNQLSKDQSFEELYKYTESVDINSIPTLEQKAFRINAYNVQVLKGTLDFYPGSSVQEVSGFFDRVKRKIEGETTTLNDYEKKKLLQAYNDPRLHFVLVCGAKGCPPIINTSYSTSTLEEQLDKQTRQALNNREFLKENENNVELSQIFKWYASDFGGSNKKILEYINGYKEIKLKESTSISYYDYDWNLNDQNPVMASNTDGNSANRYVVSAAIPKGSYEIKVFNNLYSESISAERSTFFTSAISLLYGLNHGFNVGLAGRYRLVSKHIGESSPFDVFGFRNATGSRSGLTALGPQIRWAPFSSLKNFSIQSSFTFPIGKDLQGGVENPLFIDWNGAVFNTQIFNDFTLNSRFSIFTELDLLIEDIGLTIENHSFRFSTPVTLIGSYFPTPKTTLYAISGFSPYWQSTFDYFYQVGVGGKYQISSNFEIEVLYTAFRNKYLLSKEGKAETINFGLRYSL